MPPKITSLRINKKLGMDELLDGPEVKKRALSCTNCRRKKIKCGRIQPCGNCMDHGVECIFPFVKRRVGSKRDKRKKDLEERLARMELLLELSNSNPPKATGMEDQSPGAMSAGPPGNTDLMGRTEHHLYTPQDTAQMLAPISSLTQKQRPSHHTSPQTARLLFPRVECADMFGSEVGWEYHGPTSFLSICSIPGITWVSEHSGEPRFFETAKALVLNIDSRLKMRRKRRREPISEPDQKTAWEWCRAYFERSFDASLGLVPKEHFEGRLRHHFAQKDGLDDDDPAWYALRNTVYASGYRLCSSNLPYSNMFHEIQRKSWQYFEKALDVHTQLLYESTGLMAVQALTAMGFFAEGLGSPSLGYMLASCATRLAQAKGLHRQPAQSWNLSHVEQQYRTQLFWTLYILEKHISYRSGRPSIIDDDDISCSLPATQFFDETAYNDSFIYIVRHAQISSRIAKCLASGKSFRQTHSKTLEVIQQLNTELQEWRDSLPPFLQPEIPTMRHGELPKNINMYHVMYLRYAYYGSIMAIHSILTHPWNSSLFGSGQSEALRNSISVSSHVVVNAARGIILDTDAIHVDASTPIWLALFFPLVSAINIFIYVLKYPALPTAPSDLALLDICTGHFSRLELASPDIALPFVREIARLARATVESVQKPIISPESLLGTPDPLTSSAAQASLPPVLGNTTSSDDGMLELFSDNWGTMFSSLNDENLDTFTFHYQ